MMSTIIALIIEKYAIIPSFEPCVFDNEFDYFFLCASICTNVATNCTCFVISKYDEISKILDKDVVSFK